MNVIKRNGEEVVFDIDKIGAAISKANNKVEDQKKLEFSTVCAIAHEVANMCKKLNRAINVEEIQDMVEEELYKAGASFDLIKEYITYRYRRSLERKANTTDARILSIIEGTNEEANQENANKDPQIASTQRDYIAGEVSNDLCRRYIYPADTVAAHDEGIIHIHDMTYRIHKVFNCCLVNLEDMLQNGTVISGTKIDRPHSFATACNIATQIVAIVSSGQYGGTTITLSHLAPFVQESRFRIGKRLLIEAEEVDIDLNEEQFKKIVEHRLRHEINDGVQTIQYQLNTLSTSNGQTPFVTVAMFLSEAKNEQEKKDLALIFEEVLKQRIQGVKNEDGVYITNAFPKLVYLVCEDNCAEDRPYWYLTELSAKCTAKRMVPDYVSEKIMFQDKLDANGVGHAYPPMGCRSFLTPWNDNVNNPKYYGRFNCGVATINLPDAALAAGGDWNKFLQIMDERLELCHKAMKIGYERVMDADTGTSPIHWQHGAIARLPKHTKVGELVKNGYATVSLGYAGLWECVRVLTGKKLTEPEGTECGLKVMKLLNEYTAKWRAAENMHYSLYGTPIESLTYKFAKALQKHYGIIEDVSDKRYVTNSYHVKVTEEINAFDKLGFEAQFQKLSPGGAISYVEVPNMQNNIPAVLEVIKFIYDHIMYAELNTKSDYCQECGYDGEIQIVENEHKKLIWKCPKCGNTDKSRMNIARRVCGYISTNDFNQGRTQEIKERVLHL